MSSAATPLTTAEFHAHVLALAPTVAVFDCDGTLWSGDAGSSFMWWSIDTGLLSADASAWLRARYDGYKRGEVSELAICGEMVQVYRGLPVAAIRAAAAEFFRRHVEPNIFPEMLALIAALQAAGTEIWAVSSTCDWVIEEGVQRFGIPTDRVLAAKVEVVDNIATNRLLDVPTDEGKVASLRGVSISAPGAVFGNSVHDAAMLELAADRGGAFAVNPSAELLRRAKQQGWFIYYPESVAPK